MTSYFLERQLAGLTDGQARDLSASLMLPRRRASSAFTTEDPAGGRIGFRARLRDPGSEATSAWSPPAHVVPL